MDEMRNPEKRNPVRNNPVGYDPGKREELERELSRLATRGEVTERDAGEIKRLLSIQADLISTLDGLVSRIEREVYDVLRKEEQYETPLPGPESANSTLTPMGETISFHNARVGNILDVLRSILDRVDI